MYHAFQRQIAAMNQMYQLASINKSDATGMLIRLQQFDSILSKEMDELGPLMREAGEATTPEDRARLVVGVADILGDIIVYCASEAQRWGIPLDQVLSVIMSSNFSKLDENGKPIKDKDDKFLKGPGYWKPEPIIAAILAGEMTVDLQLETFVGGVPLNYVGRGVTAAAASQTGPSDSGSPAAESHP